jgi:DNA primase large subunit
MEMTTLARYPFLPGTSEFLKDQDITLEDVVSSSAFARAREAGKRRVMEAFVEGRLSDRDIGDGVEQLIELLSYLVARMIVSCNADELLIQRYALAEATLVQERLSTEEPGFVGNVAVQLGLDVRTEGSDIFMVHFSDYLRHSSQMRSEVWKLVNQEMVSGRVFLNKTRLARLLQHTLQERIASELPLTVNDKIERVFMPAIQEVREEIAKRKARFERESYGRVSFLRLPPCMKEMLAMMKRGENVPHVGRFALTAFLHYIGMGNEDIVATFSTSPDFNEHLARYQIEHITGRSSGIEYLPPECATMKSRGVCFNPDSLCDQKWMTHPLTYYRAKGKKRRSTAGGKGRARSEEPAEQR